MTKNPVVAHGACRLCGQPVALFDRDAAAYIDNPQRGLAHFDCQTGDIRQPTGEATR